MKMRLLTLAFAAILLPLAFGCGGGESSYKDRESDVDAESIDLQAPGGMDDGETGDSAEADS